ncbi:PREDICTED: MOB kinase activator [Prunus dulcis]|uniref:PREDICTED: MOB kinase activator n=5 Tax=Prunus TaxID=3754 RepID=A0A5E4EQS9_PRUDU|nr:PREDICTED: MOB kinase activator [Prunus dulcis]
MATVESEIEPTFGCKWVFKIKRRSDGSIEQYNAHLLTKGFHQQSEIDYFDTFSLVVKPTTIPTILSIAISCGWGIRQLDVKNAFPHGYLSEAVFMQQPPGFADPLQPTHVCKLHKAVYSLKQAPLLGFRARSQLKKDEGLTTHKPLPSLSRAMSLFGLGRNQRTFRPKKSAPSGSKGAQLRKHIDATLGSGNLREAVKLPTGEDLNEWLAVNTVDFFNQVNLLYGTLTEFCTPENCPTMTAGPKYEYRWADGVLIKKPIEVSAPKYVEYLMDWIESQLDDESIFPQKLGAPFPPNFREVVKTIFKRLFRVYAHIYHSHFQKIVSLKEEAHLNTCFKHFILFTCEFGLIDKKELAPLQELIESIIVPY